MDIPNKIKRKALDNTLEITIRVGKQGVNESLIDELKQIQGFPKNYEICGNRYKQITQIGNAVPSIVVEKIINNLLK